MKLIKKFLKTDLGIALLITVAWKTAMLTIGYLIDSSSIGGASSIVSHTYNWDSGWYIAVISGHYITDAAAAAFYPLFPLLVIIIKLISFNSLDILVAGQIVNTIAVWSIIIALLKLGREFLDDGKKYWLIALVLFTPAAFFLHVFYGEAIFMALSLWAYIFALRHKWLTMGIILAILTSARLPAILVVGLCGLEFMRSYNWDIKRYFNRNLLYFLLAPIGFIVYGIYLLIVRGDFLAMFHAYSATNDWSYQIFDINFIKTILRSTYEVVKVFLHQRSINNELVINYILPLSSIMILAIGSIYLLLKQKGKYIPLGIYGLTSIVMFTLNSNVVSVHRYILPCLTFYVALALMIKGRYRKTILICLCLTGAMIQFIMLSMFILHGFVG